MEDEWDEDEVIYADKKVGHFLATLSAPRQVDLDIDHQLKSYGLKLFFCRPKRERQLQQRHRKKNLTNQRSEGL